MVRVGDEKLHAHQRRNSDWSCKCQTTGRGVRQSVYLNKLTAGGTSPRLTWAGGPSYREAKGGALRLGRVAERWDKFPGSRVWLLCQCDSISTTSSSRLSQRQRTGVSAL